MNYKTDKVRTRGSSCTGDAIEWKSFDNRNVLNKEYFEHLTKKRNLDIYSQKKKETNSTSPTKTTGTWVIRKGEQISLTVGSRWKRKKTILKLRKLHFQVFLT